MSTTFKDFFQNIFDTSSERIKNPFVGSYITAFILYNWRPILFLFLSDKSIEKKIIEINTSYDHLESILWPLIIAVFYVLLLPYINLIFEIFLSYSTNRKEKRRKEIIINNLVQKKEEARYEREIANERAGTNEIETLNSKITILEAENELKSNEIVESNNKLINELNDRNVQFEELNINLNRKIEEYNLLLNSNNRMLETYELLINETSIADAKIKKFLKNDLTINEISNLRMNASTETLHDLKIIRKDIISLLVKAKIYDKYNGYFQITQNGKKFIEEL